MASFNLSSSSSPALSCLRASKEFKLMNDVFSVRMISKFPSRDNAVGRINATLISGGGDLLSFPNSNDILIGFASIAEAIEDIRQGKMVVVVDDEDRENEGDLIMAAQLVTPEAMAFIVKHGTGIICVSMKEEDLDRLDLPLMVNSKDNDEKLRTAFTVTVDAKHDTTTGVSAHDRATTVLALASRDSTPEDFNRPGHIFPLKYREGGVLKRAGHTEASVDLAVLAGLNPAAVLCEIVDDDGSMARLPKLRQFAELQNLKFVSIADLIRYRRKRDKLVDRSSAARIPTMWGPFTVYGYRSILDGIEHIAMVKGEIGDGEDVLVRQIEAAGRGVMVYLRGHEVRGIGLGHKLRAYNLQDDDTLEANEELGVRSMKLMTNNPAKYVGLKGYGLTISGRIWLLTPITSEHKRFFSQVSSFFLFFFLFLPLPSTSPPRTSSSSFPHPTPPHPGRFLHSTPPPHPDLHRLPVALHLRLSRLASPTRGSPSPFCGSPPPPLGPTRTTLFLATEPSPPPVPPFFLTTDPPTHPREPPFFLTTDPPTHPRESPFFFATQPPPTPVSHPHPPTSYPHTPASYPHPSVSHPHLSTSHPHTLASHPHPLALKLEEANIDKSLIGGSACTRPSDKRW
ncbi:hypothetical protein Fmac_001470 [Flemingia macrophylla]|uniref:GTP cyclohydrolase II domain-containing protein n=1 Tax=Flemingia macrophylla TaxID=520843 RepID=A0ABD1NH76_9FABA